MLRAITCIDNSDAAIRDKHVLLHRKYINGQKDILVLAVAMQDDEDDGASCRYSLSLNEAWAFVATIQELPDELLDAVSAGSGGCSVEAVGGS